MTASKKPSKAELEQAIADGLLVDEFVKRFGVSAPMIRRYIKQMGLYETYQARIHTDNYKQRISARYRDSWADPTAKAYRSSCLKKAWESPEARAKMAAIVHDRWSDPSYRIAISEGVRRTWQDPDLRRKKQDIFDTPEHKAKLSDARRETWKDPDFKAKMVAIFNAPNSLAKNAARTKARWQDATYREKMANIHSRAELRNELSERSKRRWQDPSYRGKMLDIFASDAYRNQISEALRERWKSAEYKEKMAAARANMPVTMTQPHIKVCDLLGGLGIKFETEKAIGPWNFDIFVPSHNLLIEVQGNYWHSLPRAQRNDKAKATFVREHHPHLQLRYIYEHEALTDGLVLGRLKHWLGIDIQKRDFEFDELAIIQPETKEADQFLYTYHYQHHGKHGTDFAGYLDGQIVVLARFTAPIRQESATSMGYRYNEVLELTRLCVHPSYQKNNLLPWFLTRCEATLSHERPTLKCLISFADTTHGHSGAVYKAGNWSLLHEVPPDYAYVTPEGWVMHKLTLYRHAKALGKTEATYAREFGFKKQFGSSKLKFVRHLQDSVT